MACEGIFMSVVSALRRAGVRAPVAAGAILGMAAAAWLGGAPGAMASPSAAQVTATATPGTQLWLSTWDGNGGFNFALATAISPNGSTVYVTGRSGSNDDLTTIAYDAATGAQLWLAGPGPSVIPWAIAVSPDGKTVYVTGSGYTTIAYNAATGAQLWMSSYGSFSVAKSVVVSPDGSTVYVTGYSQGATSSDDYVTVAYNAATGAQRWLSKYNNGGIDQARSIAISPSGGMLYVTGRSAGRGFDAATVAYKASNGARVWVSRYNGKANKNDYANGITVAPNGRTVFITGGSIGKTSFADYATVAYDAKTGRQLWVKRYNGPANLWDYGRWVAVTPNSNTVVVTGYSWGGATAYDYATIAYNAHTGAPLWTSRYSATPPGYNNDQANAIAISPDGTTAYVTGYSENAGTESDFATVAYSVATGAQLWASRYDDPSHSFDSANAMVLSPDGSTLYVTGYSEAGTSPYQYATIAYQT
jgi:DNA-binding beta-propeller fold protein YncE